MGENLALNIEEKGFRIAVFNRSLDKVDDFVAQARGKKVIGARSLKELAASIARPRRIIIMVKAGAAVDATIAGLVPHLEAGDVVIDGGNELFTNTERRGKELADLGLDFVGMGVSGGEEGARHGPSLMPGCTRAAYAKIEDVVTKIAAQVADGPCVTHVGPGGAGHYVKMVHNGIEYGDMQLIAEAYD
ncbi:NAD(P)-binding domain-containing protein, partial [Myxococcota bacterium]|nr:NAD(P)-binding domain-containing protein [Myxococcota bacterium]